MTCFLGRWRHAFLTKFLWSSIKGRQKPSGRHQNLEALQTYTMWILYLQLNEYTILSFQSRGGLTSLNLDLVFWSVYAIFDLYIFNLDSIWIIQDLGRHSSNTTKDLEHDILIKKRCAPWLAHAYSWNSFLLWFRSLIEVCKLSSVIGDTSSMLQKSIKVPFLPQKFTME